MSTQIKRGRGRPRITDDTIRKTMPVRIPVFKHRLLKVAAAAAGKTLTQFIEDKLDK